MRRHRVRPRLLRLRSRALSCWPLWLMLAVAWSLQGVPGYAQADIWHQSPTWVEIRAAFERLRLPGLEPFPEQLEARLWKAYQAKGPDYQPRTPHRDAHGVPRYINRLILEASPYLLQHAHNPVNWYAWGPEAFAAAKTDGKVILLSIGYSTCYWCHVMEQESYEDEAVAELLNRHFIPIKVDREERPDVDKIYMDAVVAMRGRGGWPLNVFLTPDLKPFWGATYFPKDQFLHVLTQISTAWRKEPSKMHEAGLKLARYLQASNRLAKGPVELDETMLQSAYAAFAASFDERFGGFGRAPKFPPSMRLQLLLRMAHRARKQQALAMVDTSLDRMARGGIYDHLGGGFHRYSTDARWLVPHFEKMLYDNASLAWTYLEAYQLTGTPMYARVARETLEYVMREMTHPDGAFYSAQDAGEVGEEGAYYVWTAAELKRHLTAEEFALVTKVYGVSEAGNFDHGTNVLHLQEGYGWDVKSRPLVASAHEKLRAVRHERAHPHTDDKILTAWNGLMIGSMAKAHQVLGEEQYLRAARRAARFLKRHLVKDGALLRRYRAGQATFDGYLDDYAYLIFGLLSLYEADFDRSWIAWARALQARQDELLWNGQIGAYYFSTASNPHLLRRSVDFEDGARPNSNAVSALNLLKLHDLTFHRPYMEKAKALLVANGGGLAQHPGAFAQTLIALDYYLDRSKEIAVIGPAEDAQTRTLLAWLWGSFLPNKTLGRGLPAEGDTLPLLARKPMIDGQTTVYVCENNVCKLPTGDLEQVKQLASDIKT
ncbi:MAG: thioredoxin domain-containing protein, partial [Candidatus Tectimicrobiota bacterium]